eukprot:5549935-Karenia_brevis.AAC.1
MQQTWKMRSKVHSSTFNHCSGGCNAHQTAQGPPLKPCKANKDLTCIWERWETQTPKPQLRTLPPRAQGPQEIGITNF